MLFHRIIESQERHFSWAMFAEGPVASALVHGLILAGALYATRHETGLQELAENFSAPVFLVPKDKVPGDRMTRERIDYILPTDAMAGMGFEGRDEPNEAELKLKKQRGEQEQLELGEPAVAPQRPTLVSIDSVYTALEVDTAVAATTAARRRHTRPPCWSSASRARSSCSTSWTAPDARTSSR
jgi:hypothetical protein